VRDIEKLFWGRANLGGGAPEFGGGWVAFEICLYVGKGVRAVQECHTYSLYGGKDLMPQLGAKNN